LQFADEFGEGFAGVEPDGVKLFIGPAYLKYRIGRADGGWGAGFSAAGEKEREEHKHPPVFVAHTR
jgi:hypothetical protein